MAYLNPWAPGATTATPFSGANWSSASPAVGTSSSAVPNYSFGGQPATSGSSPDQQFSNLYGQQAQQSLATGREAAALADPFAPQRGQYQGQLQTLMTNPGEFGSSPAYQFAFDQGMNAVNRTAAAKGQLNSGNRLQELTKFGQGLASQLYPQQAGILSNLAGVHSGSPAAAGISLVSSLGRAQDQQALAATGRAAAQNPYQTPQPRVEDPAFQRMRNAQGGQPANGGYSGGFGQSNPYAAQPTNPYAMSSGGGMGTVTLGNSEDAGGGFPPNPAGGQPYSDSGGLSGGNIGGDNGFPQVRNYSPFGTPIIHGDGTDSGMISLGDGNFIPVGDFAQQYGGGGGNSYQDFGYGGGIY